MEKNDFGQDFWSKRWIDKETKWDMGYPSTPLKEFIDTLNNKAQFILIPGCGNAYEAEYLHTKGFTNVFVLDFAPLALEEFSKRVPDFPKAHLISGDFFMQQETGKFDLVLEQTFFCAIHPSLRKKYVQKMFQLLKPGGSLAGVLFNDPLLTLESPPFRGSEDEYRTIFSPYFSLDKLEPAQNSIPPRAGRELFFHFRRKEKADDEV